MTVLKGEIRNYKIKFDDISNYNGRITDYEEFRNLVMKILNDYKPKKKEQEEVVKKLRDHLAVTIDKNADAVSTNSEKKKGGFFGIFSKKK